jgi:alkanesulfonate monooxygenase SsuD/methylene tetrahydromethanopterin reductase-like flavin-dependent oxidoreductase (luciferase family)
VRKVQEFGLFVQQDNPITEQLNESVGPSFYLKAASNAERLGYDSFWLPDHWLLSHDKAVLDCWTVLSAVAAVTTKIKVGPLVTPITAHSPFLLAKRGVTLQMLSKGRLQFGIGAGWHRQEFLAAGISFGTHQVRLEQLEDSIKLLKCLWEKDASFDFNGRHYSASGALLRPRAKIPPLWLGGTSDRLLELVSKYADGWVAFEIHQKDLTTRIEDIRSRLVGVGRRNSDVRIGLATRVVAAKTQRDAEKICHRMGLKRDYLAPDLPEGLQGHLIAGGFDECAAELAGFIDEGVEHVIISPQPPDRTMESLPIFMDEVIKRIK